MPERGLLLALELWDDAVAETAERAKLVRGIGAVLKKHEEELARAIALDVVETPEAYIVKAELPGIAKDKIEVNVEDRDVTIGAEFLEKMRQKLGPMLFRQEFEGEFIDAVCALNEPAAREGRVR